MHIAFQFISLLDFILFRHFKSPVYERTLMGSFYKLKKFIMCVSPMILVTCPWPFLLPKAYWDRLVSQYVSYMNLNLVLSKSKK